MTTIAVIGHDTKVGSIRAFLLADVAAGPAAPVVSGEPGIGKTALWEAGVVSLTYRSTATTAQMASTTPNGHAPDKNQ